MNKYTVGVLVNGKAYTKQFRATNSKEAIEKAKSEWLHNRPAQTVWIEAIEEE